MSGKGKGKLLTLGQAQALMRAASSGGKPKKGKRKGKGKKKGKRNLSGVASATDWTMERRQAKMFPGGRNEADMCTIEYMQTLMNPFQLLTPCSPLSVSRRAFRYTSWMRVDFDAGASGLGFISYNPYLGFRGTNSATYSTLASVMVGTTTLNAVTNVGVSLSNSPVTVDLSGVAEVRLVAAGMRIRCVSPPLEVTGSAYLGRAVANEETDLVTYNIGVSNQRMNRISAYDLLSEDGVIIWCPEIPADFEYYANNTSNFPCGASLFGPLCCLVNSAIGAKFHAEMFGHYEFISNATAAFAVPGHSDPRALPMVEAVTNNLGGLASSFMAGVSSQLAGVAGATPAYLVNAVRSYANSQSRTMRAIMN
jgi:hypothetical protein